LSDGDGTSLTINTVDTTNSVIVSLAGSVSARGAGTAGATQRAARRRLPVAAATTGVAVTLESDGARTVVELNGSPGGPTMGGADWRGCNRASPPVAVACAVAQRGSTTTELVELVGHAQPASSGGSRSSFGTTITLVTVPS
jgi:hypothetical protein